MTLPINADERATLLRLSRSTTSAARLVLRSRIVLLAASGLSDRDVARKLAIAVNTAALWRRRFLAGGLLALQRDAPGRGRKPTIDLATRLAVLAAVRSGAGIRDAARTSGISPASASRITRTHRQLIPKH
jgi:transposase